MFYLNNNERYKLHEYVIIKVDRINYDIMQLEYSTGLEINSNELLYEIIECLNNEKIAKIQLEYLCMDLVQKHCNGAIYLEFQEMLDFILHYGKSLMAHIKSLGLYNDNYFHYKFLNKRNNILVLARKDIYYKRFKEGVCI